MKILLNFNLQVEATNPLNWMNSLVSMGCQVFRKASAFNQDLSGWLDHSPGPQPYAWLFADESGCPGCLPAGSASCTCGFRTEISRRRRLLRMRNLGTFLAEDEFANIETNIVADLDS